MVGRIPPQKIREERQSRKKKGKNMRNNTKSCDDKGCYW
jgi:hypothetical protein